MEVKTELVIRLLVAVFLAFVVGKILVTLFRGFFSNFWSSPEKNRVDIDQMIKKQVRILKEADSQDETGKSQNSKEEKKYQSLTEKKYRERFDTLSEGEEKSKLKKAMVFFDNCQWGEGIFFNKVREKVEKKFNTKLEMGEISILAHYFLREDFFLKTGNSYPSIDEMGKLMEHGLFLKKIISEAKLRKGTLIGHLSKRESLEIPHLSLGIEYFILSREKKGKSTDSLIPMLLGGDYIKRTSLDNFPERKIHEIILDYLIDEKERSFVPISENIHNLIDNAHIFSCLSRITHPKGKMDLSSAFKIFNLETNVELDEVKKVYKKLAKLKHPDRLSSLNIPEKYIGIANDNFSTIQEAYKLILNFKKK
ncbi:J domain-containing protein [Bacteriovoracales bacterium]|nr:J domain-containing protein [Bacteriovoracales bacterium]